MTSASLVKRLCKKRVSGLLSLVFALGDLDTDTGISTFGPQEGFGQGVSCDGVGIELTMDLNGLVNYRFVCDIPGRFMSTIAPAHELSGGAYSIALRSDVKPGGIRLTSEWALIRLGDVDGDGNGRGPLVVELAKSELMSWLGERPTQ